MQGAGHLVKRYLESENEAQVPRRRVVNLVEHALVLSSAFPARGSPGAAIASAVGDAVADAIFEPLTHGSVKFVKAVWNRRYRLLRKRNNTCR